MLMTEAMVLACGLAASGEPLAGQEVIELTGEDRILDAGFEELYRVGSLQGGDWDTFGSLIHGRYQIRRTAYRSKSDSIDTSGKSCASDWAINMRSNGSRCGPGSLPARSACATVIASG